MGDRPLGAALLALPGGHEAAVARCRHNLVIHAIAFVDFRAQCRDLLGTPWLSRVLATFRRSIGTVADTAQTLRRGSRFDGDVRRSQERWAPWMDRRDVRARAHRSTHPRRLHCSSKSSDFLVANARPFRESKRGAGRQESILTRRTEMRLPPPCSPNRRKKISRKGAKENLVSFPRRQSIMGRKPPSWARGSISLRLPHATGVPPVLPPRAVRPTTPILRMIRGEFSCPLLIFGQDLVYGFAQKLALRHKQLR